MPQLSSVATDLPSAWLALLQAALLLAAVGAVFWLVVKSRGFTRASAGNGLHVEARAPLDTKNTLWVVDVEGKRLLIGTADGAPPRVLSELEAKAPTRESDA